MDSSSGVGRLTANDTVIIQYVGMGVVACDRFARGESATYCMIVQKAAVARTGLPLGFRTIWEHAPILAAAIPFGTELALPLV